MKKTSIILAFIVVLIALFLQFLPSNYKVERSIVINRKASVVFNKVNTASDWKWQAWYSTDPDMGIELTGPDEGVDAKRCWSSDNIDVGNGCLTIIESKPNSMIKTQIDIAAQNPTYGTWMFVEKDGVTSVDWKLEMDMGSNFIGKVVGLFMENRIAYVLEEGLENLKKQCETGPEIKQYPIEIEYMQMQSQPIYSIKDSAITFELGDKFSELFVEISTHVAITGAEVTGQPIAIWHKYDPSTKHIIEAAIPVAVTGESEGRVQAGSIAEGNVVRAVHIGSYQSASKAYMVIEEYIADNGYVKAGASWEQYMTDPVSQPDTSKWITHIYLPVK